MWYNVTRKYAIISLRKTGVIMLNEEKVKSMTKAAAYEKGPEKKNIDIGTYFRVDYLGLQMVRSGIAYAVAFVILTALWVMGKSEEFMLMLSHAEYLKDMIKSLAVLFVSGLAVYEGLVYIYYSYRYKEARKSLKGYHSHLNKIHKFYETQESAEESKTEKDADEENTL